jgi:beta-lactam-binding protein with PASTA domain
MARDRFDERDPRRDSREDVTEVVRERRPPPPWWRERWWIWGLVLLLFVAGLIAFFALRDDDGEEAADTAAVPELIGLQEDDAVQRVEQRGLESAVQRAASEEDAGTVIDQSPDPGTELEQGARVLIVVAAEEEVETETETITETETVVPETVEVPDVVGEDHQDAGRTIDDAGLIANTYPVPSQDLPGTVVAQTPRGGSELPEGSAVRLNVALGPDPRDTVEVPDLTGDEVRDALERCREQFTCRVLDRDAPSDEEAGEVLDQRPAAGTSVEELSQITLFVAR